ncbi:hypothetical protein GCM10014713_24200 [Streptomyces purpureus]|uniref:Uncharacterized protein n=1 Tax=Streptomyces purpureus TaxID=1951 RepID=A0A918H2Q1_9ACTN|nr:hypothetical protein GCM10014713_24200 [Streptomyces purpureus]
MVQHQRVAHPEGGGDIGDPDRRHPARLDLFDGGAQHLLAPFLHAQANSGHGVTVHSATTPPARAQPPLPGLAD